MDFKIDKLLFYPTMEWTDRKYFSSTFWCIRVQYMLLWLCFSWNNATDFLGFLSTSIYETEFSAYYTWFNFPMVWVSHWFSVTGTRCRPLTLSSTLNVIWFIKVPREDIISKEICGYVKSRKTILWSLLKSNDRRRSVTLRYIETCWTSLRYITVAVDADVMKDAW